MKHGLNAALIDESLPVVCIATTDPTSVLKYEKTLSNIQEVTARGGRVIAIESDDEILNLVEHTIPRPPNYSYLYWK